MRSEYMYWWEQVLLIAYPICALVLMLVGWGIIIYHQVSDKKIDIGLAVFCTAAAMALAPFVVTIALLAGFFCGATDLIVNIIKRWMAPPPESVYGESSYREKPKEI